MRVICFAGQMIQGKDVAADYLAEILSKSNKDAKWNRVAFGDAVKETFMKYLMSIGISLKSGSGKLIRLLGSKRM